MGLRKVEATLLLCLTVDVNKSILKIAILVLFTIEIETSLPLQMKLAISGHSFAVTYLVIETLFRTFVTKSVYWIKKEFDQISETLLQILLLD